MDQIARSGPRDHRARTPRHPEVAHGQSFQTPPAGRTRTWIGPTAADSGSAKPDPARPLRVPIRSARPLFWRLGEANTSLPPAPGPNRPRRLARRPPGVATGPPKTTKAATLNAAPGCIDGARCAPSMRTLGLPPLWRWTLKESPRMPLARLLHITNQRGSFAPERCDCTWKWIPRTSALASVGIFEAFTGRRPQMTRPTPPTVVGCTITRAAEPWNTSSFGYRNVVPNSQAPLVACILTCVHVSGRCTECARKIRRVRYDAFGLRRRLAACSFYVRKKVTSTC